MQKKEKKDALPENSMTARTDVSITLIDSDAGIGRNANRRAASPKQL